MTTDKAPKLVNNGLTLAEYGRLHYVDKAIRDHGAAIVFEIFNTLHSDQQAIRKIAHAHDAAEFFQARTKKELRPAVVHKEGKPHKRSLALGTFNRDVLAAMYDHHPRLARTTVQLPYNTDYFHPDISGISPIQQQAAYHVLREVLQHNYDPEEVFSHRKVSDFEFPPYLTASAIKNARGAFFEMYVGACLMCATQEPYSFFSRVSFPLWDDAHLNGHPLDGQEVECGKKRIRAEIDIIFATENPHATLDAIVKMHKHS